MMVRHAIFNFKTNLTMKKRSLSVDWDLGIFNCRLGKNILFTVGNGAHIWPQILANKSPGVTGRNIYFLCISPLKICFFFANSNL